MATTIIKNDGCISRGSTAPKEDVKPRPGVNNNSQPYGSSGCTCCGRHLSKLKSYGNALESIGKHDLINIKEIKSCNVSVLVVGTQFGVDEVDDLLFPYWFYPAVLSAEQMRVDPRFVFEKVNLEEEFEKWKLMNPKH